MKTLRLLLVAIAFQVSGAVVFGQQTPPLDAHLLFVSPQEFVGEDHLVVHNQLGYPRVGAPSRGYYANLNLPEGARILYAEMEYCHRPEAVTPPDTTYMFVTLETGSVQGNTILLTSAAEAPCGRLGKGIWSYGVVNAKTGMPQWAELYFGHDGGIEAFGGLRVFYELNVPDPPNIATFVDVPTGHPFFKFVEALSKTGAVAGCGNGKYCPDAPVTRGQLAVFLSAIFGLGF